MTMKRDRPQEDEGGGNKISTSSKKSKQNHENMPTNENNQMTELLKKCLQKVCELQSEIQEEGEDDDDNAIDAEVAGYTACAVETLRFLAAEGLPPDHPLIRSLSQRLLIKNSQ